MNPQHPQRTAGAGETPSPRRSGEPLFRPADADDVPRIRALLELSGLPTSDIPGMPILFTVVEGGTDLDGVVGLDVHGDIGLLRSLAVVPARRDQGLGRKLVDHALATATLNGVRELYLLTTTAAPFFERYGFERVPRAQVPASLRETTEFASLCPASAVCMRRRISGDVRYFPKGTLALRPDVPGADCWAVQLDRVMLTYFEVQANARFERHAHDAEQITMVLEGSLVFECDGRPPIHVRAGETIAIPSQVPHAVSGGAAGAKAVDAWSPPHARYAQGQNRQ